MFEHQLEPAAPPALVRSLGVVGVLFLTLSVTSPVSSLFVIVPGMMRVAGTGAIWAMLLAGLVCVATAYVYAELSSNWPVAGGEYVMVARTLGPMSGFVMLGVNVFNNLLFPPAVGLGLASVLGVVIPGIPAIPLAVTVVAGATLVSLLHIRVNAWVTGIFLLIEVLAVLAVVALGFGHAVRPLGAMLTDPVMSSAIGDALIPTSAASIGLATSIAIFALNGYGAAVYFGEEMHEAPRKIARAVFWAVGLTLLLEGLPLVAVLVGAPDLPELLASDDPFGLIVRMRAGDTAAMWVSIGVAVAIVNAIIACILACARFFYGTARDRCWGRPIDNWLVTIHPRVGSPWISTLIVGGAGIACCFLPLELLLVLSGTGLVAIYAGIALALMAGRRSGLLDKAPFKSPLYPLMPVVTLLALGYVVWLNWLDLEEGRMGLIMTGVQMIASALYYWFVLRRRGRWDVFVPALAREGS
ncbi:MAG: amino acid transporter [Sphingomonas sp. 28-66-16]|nr:MAG: amino acid transporter [Sphingomonas sp. 28-66-16]